MSDFIRTPITADEMKPGDEIVRAAWLGNIPYQFVGLTSSGDLVLETPHGDVSTWPPVGVIGAWCRLDPKPKPKPKPKPPPRIPEHWRNWYGGNSWSGALLEKPSTDGYEGHLLAVLHVWTDDDGYHAEFEPVES